MATLRKQLIVSTEPCYLMFALLNNTRVFANALKTNIILRPNNYNIRIFFTNTSELSTITIPTKMQRIWVPSAKDFLDSSCQQYRLLSYNILAQELLTDNMFLYYDIKQKYLRWKNRIALLGEEIRKIRPDIFCLQEVQHIHLKDIVNLLASNDDGHLKLEYVFKKRTGSRCDGCLILYDREKFKLIKEHCVEYHTENHSISDRENIAVLAKFAPKNDLSKTFVVSTTHLLYNPRRHDVRICQINKLLAAIIDFAKESTKNYKLCPIILTGDFNCTNDSGPFRILTAERRFVCEETNKTNQQFKMYPLHFGDGTASTYQNQWTTVDYILKSSSEEGEDFIQINSTYHLPQLETCQAHGKLPNKYIGSDHFCLAIQFSII